MKNDFIVLTPFQYMIECTCPRPEHTFILDLHKGDIITVTEEKKYVDSLGWLLLVMINDYSFFMFVDEIEEFIANKKITSLLDLELRMNYLDYKVNESLDVLNKEKFDVFARELNDLKAIQKDRAMI
ncbi:hypothetical protein ACTQ5K_12710 [Niallia sp. Sow4_A1]|uniref:IDEAL domain-containing protein n=1 Tax=Niallia hominis TaxID=3133173 RepID=A0ABV1F525_9BACI|nr:MULTISPECIES: hypothetical protein [Bacillaceae]MCF2649608.1 hypothetical protein [Niallia circulans]MCM3362127.1 hypothetical protein [Niallia sp. MER TA 168]CAI9386764.1 hypothetical protein BACSP_01743 [Bacillus sp. T2.9-1]